MAAAGDGIELHGGEFGDANGNSETCVVMLYSRSNTNQSASSLQGDVDLNFRDYKWPQGAIRYARIEGSEKADLRRELWKHSGKRLYPQIFVKAAGAWDDVSTYDFVDKPEGNENWEMAEDKEGLAERVKDAFVQN